MSLEQLEIVMQTWVEGVWKNGQNLITTEIREECQRLIILVTFLDIFHNRTSKDLNGV